MQLMLAVWDREREHGDKLQEGLQEIMVPYFTHQDFGKLNSLWPGPHTETFNLWHTYEALHGAKYAKDNYSS